MQNQNFRKGNDYETKLPWYLGVILNDC